jgi:hypothetical protein
MPNVGREGPYRLYFYSNEGSEPPHVHVDRGRLSAKVWVNPVRVGANHGFPAHELTQIVAMVRRWEQRVIDAWRDRKP